MSRCAERWPDSISWRRFCRIPLGGSGAASDHVDEADHPVRVDDAVAGLNEALLAKAADGEVAAHRAGSAPTPPWCRLLWPSRPIRVCWPRRCVAIGPHRRADQSRRRREAHHAARDRAPLGGSARALDRREAAVACGGGQQRDQAQTAVLRSTGELAGLAEPPPVKPSGCWRAPAGGAPRERQAAELAARVAHDAAAGRRRGRLRARGQRPGHHRADAPTRRSSRRPASRLSGRDPRVGESGASACTTVDARPIRQGPPRQAGRVRLQGPDRRQRRRGRRWTTLSDRATRPTRRSWPRRSQRVTGRAGARRARSPPTAATAKPSVDRELHRARRHAAWRSRAKANLAPRPRLGTPPSLPRTRSNGAPAAEGRISHLKRGYGWDRTALTGHRGAPELVADTASSLTTSSRSRPSRRETGHPAVPPRAAGRRAARTDLPQPLVTGFSGRSSC